MTPSGGREGRQAILESPSDGGDDSVIYSGSDDDHYDSPTERQRRCNVQHNRFLDGRPVVILSAQLKGPFTKESGWRNPWLPKPTSPLAAGIPKATHRLASFREIASHSLQLQSPDSLSSERRPPINPYMQDTAWSRIQTWRRDVNPRDGLPLPVTPVKPSKPSTNAGNKRPASSAFLRSALAKKSKPNGFGQLMDECPSKPIRDHSSISADSAWTVSATSTAAIKASGKSHLDLSGSSQAAVDVSLAPESYSARALKNDHSISCNITTGASLGPPPTRGSSRVAVDMGMRRNGVRRPLSQPKAPVPKTNVPRPLAVRIHPVVHREGTMEDEADGRHPAGAVGLRAPTDTIEAHSRELNFQSQADQSFHYRSKAPNAANQVDDDEVEQIRFQPRSATSQSDLEDTESSMSEAGHRQSEEAAGIHVHQDKDSCTDETSSTNSQIRAKEIATTEATDLGIDGPTLVPVSTVPEPHGDAPQFTSDGTEAPRDFTTLNGDNSGERLVSISKRAPQTNHGCQGQKETILSTFSPKGSVSHAFAVGVETSDGVGSHQEPKDDAAGSIILPKSQSGRGLDSGKGSQYNGRGKPGSHDNPSVPAVIAVSAPEPESEACPVPPPLQQSPWTKFSLSQAIDMEQLVTAEPQERRPTEQTPAQQEQRSRLYDSLDARALAGRATRLDLATSNMPIQQSPWSKEHLVEAIPVANMGLVTKSSARSSHLVTSQGSQNPWDTPQLSGADLLLTSPTSPKGVATGLQSLHLKQLSALEKDVMIAEAPAMELPSTPTRQSSLPTPDFTLSIKSFRQFMTPSPRSPRRPMLSSINSKSHNDKSSGRLISALSDPRKRGKRPRRTVSFAPLPDDDTASNISIPDIDPDETMEGAELPTREATKTTPVSSRRTWSRAASPPLQISQSELPAEVEKFQSHYATIVRKGPQMVRRRAYRPLLPSASRQSCGSPGIDAMAEAFIEADQAHRKGEITEPTGANGVHHMASVSDDMDDEMSEPEQVDDVAEVLQNLNQFLDSFDVDVELERARKEAKQNEKPQDLGVYLSGVADPMAEVMALGVWD